MLDTFKSIGVTNLIPVDVPDVSSNVSAINVERAAFFDEHARAGHMKEARGGQQANGRLVSAPDYIQSQRVRMMMMMKLAEATSNVDVYIVASNNNGAGGPGGGGRGGPAGGPPAGGPPPERQQSPTQRHSNMANLACYPAINLPNGFGENGSPTNATIFAQPFREAEILAVAKAYQDAAGFIQKKPKLDQVPTTQG